MPGDRVKTDRRDAEHEAPRDLVRAREAAKKDELLLKRLLNPICEA
jgi:hypothetical protein